MVDASQFLATLGSYDSVADRKLGASETDERTLAHLLIDQVELLQPYTEGCRPEERMYRKSLLHFRSKPIASKSADQLCPLPCIAVALHLLVVYEEPEETKP